MNAAEFIGVSKYFGKFAANDDISFSIEKNTIHCVIGENGAGKSTLMNLLYGIYTPDSGKILINGREVSFRSPHDAIAMKIGMVHQHFMLIDEFTVLENVILGNEPVKGLSIDFSGSGKVLSILIDKFSLGISPGDVVSKLSISQQQKVEILKLLYRDSDILIFDEPTAVLSPVEVSEFFRILEEFKQEGKTIVLITHKLNEVKQAADKVTVLRKGKLVYQADNSERNLDAGELSRAIVGESVTGFELEKKKAVSEKLPVLKMSDVTLVRDKQPKLNGLSLELRKGEILGICGVEGNGQNEIADIIAGLEKEFKGVLEKKSDKVSFVPDDRIRKGMVKEFTIGENIILRKSERVFVTGKLLAEVADEVIREFDVRVSDNDALMGSLSGGNQQKVIVARETDLDSDIMIFSHPTRGVDINATVFIHKKISEEREKGRAILLISSDLDELLLLSDRLSVIYNGRIVRTFGQDELTGETVDTAGISGEETSDKLYDKIGKLMIGIED